jgi:hypothetical protein
LTVIAVHHFAHVHQCAGNSRNTPYLRQYAVRTTDGNDIREICATFRGIYTSSFAFLASVETQSRLDFILAQPLYKRLITRFTLQSVPRKDLLPMQTALRAGTGGRSNETQNQPPP